MNEETVSLAVKMCNRKSLNSVQQKVSATIPSENGKVTKILSLKACASVASAESYTGGVKLALDVMYRAVVCLETGEITCLEQTVTGTNVTYESSFITQESKVFARPTIVDSETNIDNGEVVVNSLVNIDILVKDNLNSFTPPDVCNTVSTKSTDNKICSQKDTISATGNVKGEINVDSKFKKIVFAGYTGFVKNIDIKTDYFVLSGEMYVTLLCEYEDGQLKTFTKAFEFNEEIEQKGVDKDDIIQINFSVKHKPEVNIVVDGNGETVIDISMPYSVTGDIYTCYNQEIIVDAYDTDREVTLTTESFENAICNPSYFAEEKIIATFNLSDDAPRVERILGSAGENISLVNTIVKEGELVLEGIANVCTIYYSEDEEGNKVLNSVLIDLPYSLSINNKELKEGDTVDVSLHLGEISVKNKKGRELEVVANVYICYNSSTLTVNAFTTEVNLGEAKQPSEYALEIVVVKNGEELWDIAKRLSVKEETLITQNPNINLPLTEGDKLVVFRQQNN